MEIKAKHRELIKNRALRGDSGVEIKKELDRIFPNETTPTLSIVEKLRANFTSSVRFNSFDPNSTTKPVSKYITFIEKSIHEGKQCKQIVGEFRQMFGEKLVSDTTIRVWFQRLKVTTAEKPHNHPLTSEIDPNASLESITINEPFVKQETLVPTDSIDSIDISNSNNSMEKSLKVVKIKRNRRMRKRKTGFIQHGLKPEKILGDVLRDQIRWFIIKWKNCPTEHLVRAQEVKQRFPHLVLQYYEDEYVNYAAN